MVIAKQDNYYGDRYALSYTGNYNFNLDNSVVFGVEKEKDAIGYNKDLSGQIDKSNQHSKYFDFQSRITDNSYFTFGSRFDEHSIAGNEDSRIEQLLLIYLTIELLKIKSSYGTGFRFPSLYEMFFVYAANTKSIGYMLKLKIAKVLT